MTFVILYALKLVIGSLRVTDEDEYEGLDVSQHSESAYSMSSRLEHGRQPRRSTAADERGSLRSGPRLNRGNPS